MLVLFLMPRSTLYVFLRYIVCIGILVFPTIVYAAPSTVTTLIQKGSDLFDDQQYEESIQTLSAALVRPGTNQEERIEIYRLLAYNYIILKRQEEADAAVRAILVLKEDFALAATESPRFRDFFSKTQEKWNEEGKPGKEEEKKAALPIKIQHTSPAETPKATALVITGTIDNPENTVGGVQLSYRTGSRGKFTTTNASYSLGRFRATIPATSISPPLVEYYLTAVDKSGLALASRGDVTAPLRVVVPAPKSGILESPWFWVPVGVVVVGGAIATAVIVSNSSDSSSSSTSTVTVNIRE